MIAPVFLIFLAAADVRSAAVAELVRAVGDVLGTEVRVAVRGFEDPPGDAALAEAGQGEGALAAARIVWSGPDHLLADIRVYVVATGESHRQPMAFETSDPMPERGRSLGFVVASYLLPSEDRPKPLDPARVAALEQAAVQRAAGERAAAARLAARRAQDQRDAARHALVAQERPWGLEAFGIGGVRRGDGVGVGGGLALRWLASPRWGLRGAGRVRSGLVNAANASSLAFALTAGGFITLAGGPGGPALGMRGELLLLYDALTRFSPRLSEPVRRGQVMAGIGGMLEGEVPIGPFAALFAAAGPELAFGPTDVKVSGEVVAELGAVRGVAEIGFRAQF